MKICIVGPGIMSIPPKGWGAVEILIWDYKETLEKFGHEVLIVNTPNLNEIIEKVNNYEPDFVHIQYDDFYPICEYIKCENKAITSHFGYLDQINKYGSHYSRIFQGFLQLRNTKIFALSPSIAEVYKRYGYIAEKISVVPNGVREDLFRFDEECLYPDRSIYLAKIDQRKRQSSFQSIPSLYFAGNIADNGFRVNENYLGEWNKEHLYENLTKYANLVLLSDGEAHPLVCLEAMSAGLGLVISEWATANLDLSLPFIDVIPENKINDIEYVSRIIVENREKSLSMRKEIREYVIKNFSWTKIVSDYYLKNI
jgi:glycosyltransferase involved in cell wall biosynthesis